VRVQIRCGTGRALTALRWRAAHLFNLKFAARQMEQNSRKCEKESAAERVKLKKVRCGGRRVNSVCLG
jgi:hypothetical protein